MENQMLKLIAQITFALIVFAGIGAYTYHVWSDCLADNSVITCARMLNK